MERVSEYLSGQDGAVSRRSIEDHVSGKGEAKRTAIDILVDEGYAKHADGPRGAKLVEFLRLYREADEEEESDNSTSSRPRPRSPVNPYLRPRPTAP
jgi:hypothetical protein